MGSVQSDVKCKKCGFPYAWEDYYYKSGEVFIFCDRCGYCVSAFWKYNKKTNEWLKDKEGNRIPDVNISGGFGSNHISKNGFGSGGHFRNHLERRKFARHYLKNRRKFEGKFKVHYTMKINGKWFFINALTDERREIPNDINYHQWMYLKNGDFRDIVICKDCEGNGGIKLEGSDKDSWKECSTCGGKGVIE